ncbi:MAG: hypothetical protein Q4A67_04195 [Aerococcus sp.]|nr:hypothetical protein [Aerococcus sp.]
MEKGRRCWGVLAVMIGLVLAPLQTIDAREIVVKDGSAESLYKASMASDSELTFLDRKRALYAKLDTAKLNSSDWSLFDTKIARAMTDKELVQIERELTWTLSGVSEHAMKQGNAVSSSANSAIANSSQSKATQPHQSHPTYNQGGSTSAESTPSSHTHLSTEDESIDEATPSASSAATDQTSAKNESEKQSSELAVVVNDDAATAQSHQVDTPAINIPPSNGTTIGLVVGLLLSIIGAFFAFRN